MRLGSLPLIAFLALPLSATAQEFFTLKGHGGPIMDIAAASDGRIATASFDNAVGLWHNGSVRWLDGHEAAVNAVVFAGNTVVSAGDDNTVRLWPKGRILGRHDAKVMGLATAPGLVASASWDGTIGIWPLDGSPSRKLEGHHQGVNAVAFAANHDRLYSAGVDGTLRLWDVESGREIRQVLRQGFGINKLVLNHRDDWLAYGSVDGVTRIIDLATDGELSDLTLERRPILALAISGDGRTLAFGDGHGYITIVDTATWRIVRDFRATLRGPVWALAFSANDRNIHAGGIDSAMYSWPLDQLDAHHGRMAGIEPDFLKDPDLMPNGERQFARKCSICHSLTPFGSRRAGPTLHGLFGRPAGALRDYRYSDTLKNSDIVWTSDSVDALFDIGPDHYIPGSKMPMQRIADPRDRADLIAYLRRATSEGRPQ